jgi:hypothetical protein
VAVYAGRGERQSKNIEMIISLLASIPYGQFSDGFYCSYKRNEMNVLT